MIGERAESVPALRRSQRSQRGHGSIGWDDAAQGAVAGRRNLGRTGTGHSLEDAVPHAGGGADVREQHEIVRVVEQATRGRSHPCRQLVRDVKMGDAHVGQVVAVQEVQGVGVDPRGSPERKHLQVAAGPGRRDARRRCTEACARGEEACVIGQRAPQPVVVLPISRNLGAEIGAVPVVKARARPPRGP